MPDTADDSSLQRQLLQLADQLEDYDPSGAFHLREESRFFSEMSFRLPVYLKSGRVSLIEAFKLSHGPPVGRFLLASVAAPSSSLPSSRRSCLERTLRACLHGLAWRGAETQVRCDPRELSPDVTALIGSALAQEARKRRSDDAWEFLLPWRRLPTAPLRGQDAPDPATALADLALGAARTLRISSPVDLYEGALLSIFPTACASRGLRMDDCTTLVRGRGSWAFTVAQAIHAAYGSPVRVEVAGRRYRPGATRPQTSNQQPGAQQQGRWESDEKDSAAQPEVIVLLGGGDPITPDRASEVKSCLLFHVHRESLSPEGETALRERGIVVVPRLLLCSMEELAADSLANPEVAQALAGAEAQQTDEPAQRLRSLWRQQMLAAWDRILVKTKTEQCSAHAAAVRLAVQGLIEQCRNRLLASAAFEPQPPDLPPPPSAGGPH